MTILVTTIASAVMALVSAYPFSAVADGGQQGSIARQCEARNRDNYASCKQHWLASGCYATTCEPCFFFSGGQGIRALNRFPGT